MRIVHLSTSNSGGAFTAAFKIHKLCKEYGHDSSFYCKYATSSINIDEKTFIDNKLYRYFLNFKLHIRKYFKNYLINSEKSLLSYFSFFHFNDIKSKGINNKLVKKIEDIDILFVHWVTNFVNINDIYEIQKKTKCRVIFTMMDMVHVTGGCHYAQDCILFHTNCINCPALKYDLKPIAYKQLLHKSSLISCFKSEIIAFSKQNLIDALNSKVNFDKYHHLTLSYDPQVYYPISRDIGKSINILGSAFTIFNERKGPSYLFESLIYLDKLSLNKNFQINFYHIDLDFEDKYDFVNINFIKFKYLQSPHDLNIFYNNIDIVMFTSVADAAPQMMAECLLSGTPVVSFNTGNAKDIIEDSIDGFVVNKYDSIELAKKTYEIIENIENWRLKRNTIHLKAKQIHSIDKFNYDLNSIINSSF